MPKRKTDPKWGSPEMQRWLVAGLRRLSYRWPPRYKVKVAARRGRGEYECASCKGIFGPREIAVDHVKPVVDPKKGFVNWDTFLKRLLVPQKGLQVLCKPCHSDKTVKENKGRKR